MSILRSTLILSSLLSASALECGDMIDLYQSLHHKEGEGAGCCESSEETELAHPEKLCSAGVETGIHIQMNWPAGFPLLGTNALQFVEDVKKTTGLEVTLDGPSPGYGVDHTFNRARSDDAAESTNPSTGNVINAYISTDYYWGGADTSYYFFGGVPFGMTGLETFAWLKYGGGQELWDETAAKFNLKALPIGTTGWQWGFHSNKLLTKPSDFVNVTVRAPGLPGRVLSKLGAISVSMGGGSIRPAAEAGELDMWEWVGAWNDKAMGFGTVGKYFYPSLHEPGAILSFAMNLKVWNSLPTHVQDSITELAYSNFLKIYTQAEYENGKALPYFANKEIVPFTDEIKHAFLAATESCLDDYRTPDFDEVRLSYTNFLKGIRKWTTFTNKHTPDEHYQLSKVMDLKIGFVNIGPAPEGHPARPVTLGLASFTGPVSFAVHAAIEDFLGVSGKRYVQVIELQGECVQPVDISSILDANVHAFLGGGCSGASKAYNAQLDGIPQISGTTTSADLTDKTAFPNFWTTTPLDSTVGQAIAGILKQKGFTSPAVVYSGNYGYSTSKFVEEFGDFCKAIEVNNAEDTWADVEDISSCDSIVLYTGGTFVATIPSSLGKPVYTFKDSLPDGALLSPMEGWTVVTTASQYTEQGMKNRDVFVAKCEEEYPDSVCGDAYTLNFYDAASVIVRAMTPSGLSTFQDFHDGVSGMVEFGQDLIRRASKAVACPLQAATYDKSASDFGSTACEEIAL